MRMTGHFQFHSRGTTAHSSLLASQVFLRENLKAQFCPLWETYCETFMLHIVIINQKGALISVLDIAGVIRSGIHTAVMSKR